MSQNLPKATNVFPPNLLGAHRYTTLRMVCALSEGSCRRHCPQKPWAKGETTFPLRSRKRSYPLVQPQNRINSVKRVNPDLRFLRVPHRKRQLMQKWVSTRFSVVTRGGNSKCSCPSAIDAAGYISREELYSEYAPERISIGIIDTFINDEDSKDLLERVKKAFPDFKIMARKCPCSIACHVGANALAVSATVIGER